MWMFVLVGAASAGDLWLTVEKAEDERVTLRLPADWLLDKGEPVRVETEQGPVDLREQARSLKKGHRTWTYVDDGERVQIGLGHRPAKGDPASQLTLAAIGPLGMGLNLSFPLQADHLGTARGKLDTALDIDGLQLDLDEAACAQLRRSPPTVLLEVEAEDGHTFRIATVP